MLNYSKNKSDAVGNSQILKSYDSSKLFMQVIIANLLVQIALQVVFYIINPQIDYDADVIYSIIIMFFIQVAFTMLYLKVLKKDKKQSKFKLYKKVKPITYALAVIAPIVMLAGLYLPTLVVEHMFNSMGYVASSLVLDSPLEFVLAIVVIVVIAPIGEELVFRGIMLSGYYDGKNNAKSILKAVFIVGALFALSHMNPMQTFYQVFLGALAGVFVILTGSVVVAMIVHIASNAVAIVISYTPLVTMVYDAFDYLCQNIVLLVLVIVILLAVSLVLLTLISKKVAKIEEFSGFDSESVQDDDNKSEQVNSQQLINQVYKKAGRLYLIVGICISVVMWVSVFAVSMGML